MALLCILRLIDVGLVLLYPVCFRLVMAGTPQMLLPQLVQSQASSSCTTILVTLSVGCCGSYSLLFIKNRGLSSLLWEICLVRLFHLASCVTGTFVSCSRGPDYGWLQNRL